MVGDERFELPITTSQMQSLTKFGQSPIMVPQDRFELPSSVYKTLILTIILQGHGGDNGVLPSVSKNQLLFHQSHSYLICLVYFVLSLLFNQIEIYKERSYCQVNHSAIPVRKDICRKSFFEVNKTMRSLKEPGNDIECYLACELSESYAINSE